MRTNFKYELSNYYHLYAYPFGMLIPDRNGAVSGTDYRYGFNGQEQETEISNSNSHTSAEYWMYDSRLGRRWNVDPMASSAPTWSPYRAMFNNPVFWSDPNGLLEWHEETDAKGNIITVADKGDDINTLKEYVNKKIPNNPITKESWNLVETEIKKVSQENDGNIEGFVIGVKQNVEETYTYYPAFGDDSGGSTTTSSYENTNSGVVLVKKEELYKKTNYKIITDVQFSFQVHNISYNLIIPIGIDPQTEAELPGNKLEEEIDYESGVSLIGDIIDIIRALKK